MKKILVYAFIFSMLIQNTSYSFAISEVRDYFLLDAIETTVKKIDTPQTDPITTALVNKAKAKALKKEVELQQKALSDIESSSEFVLIKWYRKKQINSKIEDLETQIKELEG